MVCPGRPYNFKFLNGCIPQIFFGPFLKTSTQMHYCVISLRLEDAKTWFQLLMNI